MVWWRENDGCTKMPRSDTNEEVGEYEVTVTSELHAQADRAKKQKREEKAASIGGAVRDSCRKKNAPWRICSDYPCDRGICSSG